MANGQLQTYEQMLAQIRPDVPAPAMPVPAAPPAQPSFMDVMTDPTSTSRFLFDLGSRLAQPIQPGQTRAGHVLGAGSQALGTLTRAKAEKAETKRRRAAEDIQTAAAKRQLESADLQDDLVRSQIMKNLKPDVVKKTGTIAAKVQERRAKAETLFKNYPHIYQTLDEALGAIDRQEFFDQVEADRTAALQKYRTERALVRTPDEQKMDIFEINQEHDLRKSKYLTDLIQNPKVTEGFAKGATSGAEGQPAPPPETPQFTLPQDSSGWKALGPDNLSNYLDATYPGMPDNIKQSYMTKMGFPDWKPGGTPAAAPAAEPTPAPAEEAPKPTTRRERRASARKTAQKRRAAKAAEAEDEAASKDFAQEEYQDIILSEDRPEMQVWLAKNRKYLTREQARKLMARITKLKGK